MGQVRPGILASRSSARTERRREDEVEEGEHMIGTPQERDRSLFCDYLEGMFAPESARAPDFSTFEFEEVLAFHEAGHAVAEYALGLGCPQISLTICMCDDRAHQPHNLTASAGGSVLYGGAASSNKRTNRRVNRLMRKGMFG